MSELVGGDGVLDSLHNNNSIISGAPEGCSGVLLQSPQKVV